jgi:hypothetical protein
MNIDEKRARPERVNRALGKCAHTVTRRDRSQWDLALKNGEMLAARARLDEEWLHLMADAGGMPRTEGTGRNSAWWCLLQNGSLPGNVKYALDPQGCLQIRAEMPIAPEETETDIRARLAATCEGFQVAAHQLHGRSSSRRRLPKAARAVAPDDVACDLCKLCEEAAWPFTERAAGKLAVALDTPDNYCQATLEQRSDGVRVTAGLGASAPASDSSRTAMAVLLLRLGGVVRMVRAAGEECNGQSAIRLEVGLSRTPRTGELAHALAALSVACRLCGREVEVLQDGGIAAEYLASRGLSS